ncbi:hypothetical protein RCL_jg7895.t1 [Rhizophagus clarus]|uniref:Uncharacterized protein n=1 Tax=Rhizophagus clarus TaxID=94130 RepID=A0A8H3MKH9_9GLOM|nr:hypothetical protein RCL_jg7895.t1 [Rhizophagus clarus]
MTNYESSRITLNKQLYLEIKKKGLRGKRYFLLQSSKWILKENSMPRNAKDDSFLVIKLFNYLPSNHSLKTMRNKGIYSEIEGKYVGKLSLKRT